MMAATLGAAAAFVARAAAATSEAETEEIVLGALEHPSVLTFGELLATRGVAAAVACGTPAGALLQAVAFGTCGDVQTLAAARADVAALLAREPRGALVQRKCQHLTVASLAAAQPVLSYARLLHALALPLEAAGAVRALEDLVIEAVYLGVVSGKLDQRAQRFEVSSCMGRDVQPARLPAMVAQLRAWSAQADRSVVALHEAEGQLTRGSAVAQAQRSAHLERVASTHANLKAILQAERAEELAHMNVDPTLLGGGGGVGGGVGGGFDSGGGGGDPRDPRFRHIVGGPAPVHHPGAHFLPPRGGGGGGGDHKQQHLPHPKHSRH